MGEDDVSQEDEIDVPYAQGAACDDGNLAVEIMDLFSRVQ